MSRNITITFSDGSSHRYENIPSTVTPDQIEARVKKDFPSKTIKNIDGGKVSAGNTELDQVKKNAGVESSSLSQFSIKGLRFGMTKEQVSEITKGDGPGTGAVKILGMLSGFYGDGFNTTDTNIKSFLGVPVNLQAQFKNNKLALLSDSFIKPNSAMELIGQLTEKFGKPSKMDNSPVQTRNGAKWDKISAMWNYQDATIVVSTRGGATGTIDWGWIQIADSREMNLELQNKKQQRQQDLKDM